MHHYMTKDPITIYGDGTMMRDYIYIDDLVLMIAGSYDKNNNYETYNIGSGMGVSINELVKSIETCTLYSIDKNHVETPATYIQNSILDVSRFTDDFGLKATIKLEEGVKRTWDYVKELK